VIIPFREVIIVVFSLVYYMNISRCFLHCIGEMAVDAEATVTTLVRRFVS